MTRVFVIRTEDGFPIVVQMTNDAMRCRRDGEAVVIEHPHGDVSVPAAEFLSLCERGCLEQVQS